MEEGEAFSRAGCSRGISWPSWNFSRLRMGCVFRLMLARAWRRREEFNEPRGVETAPKNRSHCGHQR